jgi:UDP-sugar pyrophosphorylase
LLQGGKDRVGFTLYDTWYCFSPAKNNCADAIACYKKGLPSFSPASAEFDFYNWSNKMLEKCGVNVEYSSEEQEFAGIPWKFGPKILLEPSFAVTFAELKAKFSGNVRISAESSVVLGGDALANPTADLKIDGTLVARKQINYFDHFSEEKIVFEAVEESDNEIVKIRGYKPKRVAE